MTRNHQNQSHLALKRRFWVTITLLLMLAGVRVAWGQLQMNASLYSSAGHTDQYVSSALGSAQSFVNNSLDLSADSDGYWRTYLQLNALHTLTDTEYSTIYGELGLQFRYLEIDHVQLFAGVHSGLTRYRSDYSYFSHTHMGGYGKARYYFAPGRSLQSSLAVTKKVFTDLPEAGRLEMDMRLAFNYSFPWRGALRVEPRFSQQHFQTVTSYEAISNQNGRWVSSALPGRRLLGVDLRLSQSLHQSLGLTLWGGGQSVDTSQPTTLLVLEAYENPFIDEFSWRGGWLAARMQWRANQRVAVYLIGRSEQRQYLDALVYEYDFANGTYLQDESGYLTTGELREEIRLKTELGASLDIGRPEINWWQDVQLRLSMGFRDHESNDPVYTFSGSYFNLSIENHY